MTKTIIKKTLILSIFIFIIMLSFNFLKVEANSFSNRTLSNELVELRTLNSKTIKIDEKTNKLIAHNANIHFTEDGVLQDIDNTLIKKNNTYITNNSNYSVSFPKKINEKKSISISHREASLDIQYININKSKAKIINGLGYTDIEHTSSRITYSNINKNVDLSFDVSTDSLKENVIINEYINNYFFEFHIKLNNLFLIKDEDSNIIFVDNYGDVVYSIGEYFMFDSSENYSNDIEVNYERVSKGIYKFRVTPDKRWMQASERTFPITIDPIVNFINNSSNVFIEDKYCTLGSSTSVNGSYLNVTYDPYYYQPPQTETIQFSLLKLNVDVIGNLLDSTILNSPYITYNDIESIKLKLTAAVDNLKDSIYVEEVIIPFSYANMNGTTSYITNNIGFITKGNYKFDIKNILKSYIDSEDNDLILKLNANPHYNGNSIRFYSTEYTSSSYQPTIEIIYTLNVGCAWNYVPVDDVNINCYAYVLNKPYKHDPGTYSDPTFPFHSYSYSSTEEIANLVENDLDFLGIGYRRLTEFNDYIYPNEYRIALNTAYHPNTIFGIDKERGYHFILQHSDGRWSDKDSSKPTKILINQYDNPSNVAWYTYTIKNEQTNEMVDVEYYNNTVIYFAIAP